MSEQTQPQENTDPSFEDVMRLQRQIWAAQAEQMAEEDAERKADDALIKTAEKRKKVAAS